MRDMVAIELIFVKETEISIFVKDEEDAPVHSLDKQDIVYDEDIMEPGILAEFTVPEGTAIDLGWV